MPGPATPDHAKQVAHDMAIATPALDEADAPEARELALSARREHFAKLLAAGFTQIDAYRQSHWTASMHPKTAQEQASRIANDPHVLARVSALQAIAIANATEGFAVSRARVLAEMYRLATYDPRKLLDDKGKPLPLNELPDDIAAAVEQVDIITGPNGEPQYRYKLARKAPSMDQLAKALGMYEADNRQRAASLAAAIAEVSAQAGISPRIGPAQAPATPRIGPPGAPAPAAAPDTPASPSEGA